MMKQSKFYHYAQSKKLKGRIELRFTFDKSVIVRLKKLDVNTRKFDDELKCWLVDPNYFEEKKHKIFPAKSGWEEKEVWPSKRNL